MTPETRAYRAPEGEGRQIKHFGSDCFFVFYKIENITSKGFGGSVASWKGLLKFFNV